MRLARRAVAAALAALLVWPTVALAQEPAQEPAADPGAEDPPGVETRAEWVVCEEAPAVFEVLCASYGLIKQHYVDDVPDEDLAAAAAQGVRDAGLAPRSEQDDDAVPPCALPAPEFEQACIEIDAVGDTAAAVWVASEAMFASLGDPQTNLMTRQEYQAWLTTLGSGVAYSGIGLRLGLLDGTVPCHALSERCRLVVAEVFPGSPAESAGIMVDDVIVSLNGYVPAGEGCGLDGLGRFEPDARVIVKVERDGRPMSFTARAGVLGVPSVAGRIVAGNTGYLRIDSFGSRTDEAVARQLRDLFDSSVESLVVDLRGNPGGFLRTVINIASMFLNDRQVVIQEVSRVEVLRHLVSGHGGPANAAVLPIAVAVDGSSASASEVMTLALRDHGRATVVGTATYGKNTGQITQAIESRDGTLLGGARITVFRWLGPDGGSAAGGIQPDVELDLTGCWHPIGLTRQVAAAAGLPDAAPADIGLGTERFEAVEALAADGVLAGSACGPGLFCPDDPIARWVMAVWLVRVLDGHDPEPVSASRFADVDGDQWWAAHVERLAEPGITGGCRREPAQYCPDDPVTRGQMATFLRRAFSFPAAAPRGFEDTGGSVHEADIDSLHRAGITAGCSTEPLRFCPEQATSRVQMALLLERVRNYLN